MTKRLIPTLILFFLLVQNGLGIPQSFVGGPGGGKGFASIAIDQTDEFIAATAWTDNALPGDWVETPALAGERVMRVRKNPILFGKIRSRFSQPTKART